MLLDYFARVMAVQRFGSYQPQPVTHASLGQWLGQFGPDRQLLLKLLKHTKFLNQSAVRDALVGQNEVLLDSFQRDELKPSDVIYVQTDDAGSSSPVMLNMLRDAAGLKQRGCRFCDSNHIDNFSKLTSEVGEGAVVYIDDFVGSGTQLCKTRDSLSKYIIGTFSEHVLSVVICEEALLEFGKRGIKPHAQYIHSVAERPMNRMSTVFTRQERTRLHELSAMVAKTDSGLGFGDMASMYVLYRDAPNNIPWILRGSEGQAPYVGVFPRHADLPVKRGY